MLRHALCFFVIFFTAHYECIKGQSALKIKSIPQFPFPVNTSFKILLEESKDWKPSLTDSLVLQVGEQSGKKLEVFVFDYGFKNEMDDKFMGTFIDVPVGTKRQNQSLIIIHIFFKNSAQFKYLRIYQLKDSSRTNRQKILNNLNLAHKIYENLISLIINPLIELTVQSNDEVDQTIEISCRSTGGTPIGIPNIKGLEQFDIRRHSFDNYTNELKVEIRVRSLDHSKQLKCFAGNVTKTLEIDITDPSKQILLELADKQDSSIETSLRCYPGVGLLADGSDKSCRVTAYLNRERQISTLNRNTPDCFSNRSRRIIPLHHQVLSINLSGKQKLIEEINENETLSLEIIKDKQCKPENRNLRRQIALLRKELSDKKMSILNLENRIKLLQNKPDQTEGIFEWRINNWRKRTQQARSNVKSSIYSDGFYSHKNGYKMTIRVYPYGSDSYFGTHVGIFFYMMQGQFDDSLSWPFMYDITLELINQHTKSVDAFYRINYNDVENKYLYIFLKPADCRGTGGYGTNTFVSLKELSRNSLIVNDSILIRCRVTPSAFK